MTFVASASQHSVEEANTRRNIPTQSLTQQSASSTPPNPTLGHILARLTAMENKLDNKTASMQHQINSLGDTIMNCTRLVETLEDRLDNGGGGTPAADVADGGPNDTLANHLPIKTYCQFLWVSEQLLIHPGFETQLRTMVRSMSPDGAIVAPLMQRILTNNLAMQISCEGKTKHKFNGPTLGTLLVLLLAPYFPHVPGLSADKQKTSKNQIDEWLKHAAGRSMRRFYNNLGITMGRAERASKTPVTLTMDQFDEWREFSDYKACCDDHKQRVRYNLLAGFKMRQIALDGAGNALRKSVKTTSSPRPSSSHNDPDNSSDIDIFHNEE